MIKAILCASLLMVLCSAQLVPRDLPLDERPEPYQFGYNTADEFGTQWSRQETADGSGAVRGSYGYKDATGIFRNVEYVADEGGFRANVQSNEPGLVSSAPAAVTYNVNRLR